MKELIALLDVDPDCQEFEITEDSMIFFVQSKTGEVMVE